MSLPPRGDTGGDFGFVLSICRVTAPTKNSSRWLLLAVGRTGLSDSFVRSFIKYILGAVARPGDQWGTLVPHSPLEPGRVGFWAWALVLLAYMLCDLWRVAPPL